eukprot:CAMPEP_0175139500 /NCGR_PEP_ID=MMETSP0087-20121206/10941_1 /TAXON_ID=136419 /ORGANISM="Unknown Unknown, Strain D1" /LENGTH=958 /DNA_ID=CAMNT_0016422525 /DNA_START=376 /DNA_END=3252 /DNA_ORIENTATION=-
MVNAGKNYDKNMFLPMFKVVTDKNFNFIENGNLELFLVDQDNTHLCAITQTEENVSVVALHAFEARSENELGFKAGDRFHVVSAPDGEDWWVGKINGKQGHVPAAYLQKESSGESAAATQSAAITVVALHTFEARTEAEIGFKEGDMFSVVSAPAGEDWWVAEINGKQGHVPSAYLKQVEAGNQADAPAEVQAAGAQSAGQVVLVVAIHTFEARTDAELGFKEGDRFRVVSAPAGEDWWVAEIDGKHGHVPSAYLQVEEIEAQPEVQHATVPVVAAHDFEPRSEHELGFKEGDKFHVISATEGQDWWIGEIDGKQGHVPAAYLKVEEEKTSEQVAADLPTITEDAVAILPAITEDVEEPSSKNSDPAEPLAQESKVETLSAEQTQPQAQGGQVSADSAVVAPAGAAPPAEQHQKGRSLTISPLKKTGKISLGMLSKIRTKVAKLHTTMKLGGAAVSWPDKEIILEKDVMQLVDPREPMIVHLVAFFSSKQCALWQNPLAIKIELKQVHYLIAICGAAEVCFSYCMLLSYGSAKFQSTKQLGMMLNMVMEVQPLPKQETVAVHTISSNMVTEVADIIAEFSERLTGSTDHLVVTVESIKNLIVAARSPAAVKRYFHIFFRHKLQFPSLSDTVPLIQSMELCKQGHSHVPAGISPNERKLLLHYLKDADHCSLLHPDTVGKLSDMLVDQLIASTHNISRALCTLYLFNIENHKYQDVRGCIRAMELTTEAFAAFHSMQMSVAFEQLTHNTRLYSGGLDGVFRQVSYVTAKIVRRPRKTRQHSQATDCGLQLVKKGWHFLDDSDMTPEEQIKDFQATTFFPAVTALHTAASHSCRFCFTHLVFRIPGHAIQQELVCLLWLPDSAHEEEKKLSLAMFDHLRATFSTHLKYVLCNSLQDLDYDNVVTVANSEAARAMSPSLQSQTYARAPGVNRHSVRSPSLSISKLDADGRFSRADSRSGFV